MGVGMKEGFVGMQNFLDRWDRAKGVKPMQLQLVGPVKSSFAILRKEVE